MARQGEASAKQTDSHYEDHALQRSVATRSEISPILPNMS